MPIDYCRNKILFEKFGIDNSAKIKIKDPAPAGAGSTNSKLIQFE